MNSKRVTRGLSSKRRTQRRKRVQRSKRRVSNRVRRTMYSRRRQKAGMRRTLRTLRGLLPRRRQGPQQDPQQDPQDPQGLQDPQDPPQREPLSLSLSPAVPMLEGEQRTPTVTTPIETRRTRKEFKSKTLSDERKTKENYGETLVQLLAKMPTDIEGKVEEDVYEIRNKQRENITLTTLGPFVGKWYRRIKESDPENFYYEFVADMELSELTEFLLQRVGDIWTIFDAHDPYRRYLYGMRGVPEVIVSDVDWPGKHFFDEYVLDNKPTTD